MTRWRQCCSTLVAGAAGVGIDWSFASATEDGTGAAGFLARLVALLISCGGLIITALLLGIVSGVRRPPHTAAGPRTPRRDAAWAMSSTDCCTAHFRLEHCNMVSDATSAHCFRDLKSQAGNNSLLLQRHIGRQPPHIRRQFIWNRPGLTDLNHRDNLQPRHPRRRHLKPRGTGGGAQNRWAAGWRGCGRGGARCWSAGTA